MNHTSFRSRVLVNVPLMVSLSVDNSKHLLWGIAGVGIALRIAQYLHNRSLWVDEAMLALNLINRSFAELLMPLDYNQGAPLGFLMVEKLIVATFGNSEYALRLFPLLCGIVSVVLFVSVAKHFVGTKALLVATGMFALSYKLIFYSSEVKQYSSDVGITLGLYIVMFRILHGDLTAMKAIAFGIAGAIMIWFSHPATFVLAGFGISLSMMLAAKAEWAQLFRLTNACILWALSLGVLYFVSLGDLRYNKELLNYWSGSFMPFPPKTLADLKWFDNAFFEMFRNPLGLFPSSIAGVTFLVGSLSLACRHWDKWLLLTFPFLFALLASGLNSYPFQGRLLLFAAPLALIVIAEGVVAVGAVIHKKRKLLISVVAGVLFIPQLIYSMSILVRPHFFEDDIRPAIEYIRQRWQDGDIIYLYHGAQPGFRFYAASYGLKGDDYVLGMGHRGSLDTYMNEIDGLAGQGRLWILFSHINRLNGIDDETLFREYLGKTRKVASFFKTKDNAVYLYDDKHMGNVAKSAIR